MRREPLRRLGSALMAIAIVACGPSEEPAQPERPAAAPERAEPTITPPPIPPKRRDKPTPAEATALGGGRWRRAKAIRNADSVVTDEMVRQLESIGYADGTRAPTGNGVTVHDPKRASPGFNFYSSAHEESARLMDMEGRVLHEWKASFTERMGAGFESADGKNRRWWRRAWLHPNGDVLALTTGSGLIKIDAASRTIWSRELFVHHDLAFRPDGRMITLLRVVHVVPRINPVEPIVEDVVVYLDAEGREERRFSLLEAFERSAHRALVDEISDKSGDIFHTNAIELLDGSIAERNPAFAKGRLLLSFRNIDAIGIVDPETESVVWSLRGSFRQQHDPQVLPNGNLLVFDNLGPGERSALLELDAETGAERWRYDGSADSPFFSRMLGVTDVLPNENILVTESDNGRVFEITPAGDLVWEWRSPHRAGDEGEFVATLPEMVRFQDDYFTGTWLQR